MPPALFFYFKTALAIQGLLRFHTNFRMVLAISVTNVIGILIRTALNQITLGRIDIFTILTFSIHQHSPSIYLCLLHCLSSMFSSFLVYRSFPSLVKYVPEYFILFDTLVKGIVCLTFPSNSLLLVPKTITDFCHELTTMP